MNFPNITDRKALPTPHDLRTLRLPHRNICGLGVLSRITTVLFAVLFGTVAFAASDPAGSRSAQSSGPKLNEFRAPGAFWRVDHTFRSRMILKNVMETDAVTVSPTIYMEDGTPYPLPETKIAPASIAVIDINQALEDLPSEVSGHASMFGSAEIRYKWDWDGVVIGQIESIDEPRSLSYTSHFVESPKTGSEMFSHRVAGFWWSPTTHATHFLHLTNVSAKAVRTRIASSAGGFEDRQELLLQPFETKWLTFDTPRKTSDMSSRRHVTTGDVEIEFDGVENALGVEGGIEDAERGFSARMPLRDVSSRDRWKADEERDLHYAAIGIMVGKPDSMMGFPASISFEPFAFLRNLGSKPIEISPTVRYMDNGVAKDLPLSKILLPPGLTFPMERESLLGPSLRKFSGTITLSFDYHGTASALLLTTGSIDASLSYVLQVDPVSIGKSPARILCYWNNLDGADTMYSLWNYSEAPQDVVLTLFPQTGKAVRVPIHLEPNASTMMNASEILMMYGNGSTARGSLQGSGKLTGPKRDSEPISVAMQTSTFNPSIGTCVQRCQNCAGYTNYLATPFPVSIAIQNYQQMTVTAKYSTGQVDDVTSTSTFYSANSGISTISGTGMGSGVSAGSTSYDIYDYLQQPGRVCSVDNPDCPTPVFQVTPPVTVQVPSYETVSVGDRVSHSGDAVKTPDGQTVVPAPCYGYSRTYTYQIWGSDNNKFTKSGTQSKETNTTTSSNPSTLRLTPTLTAGTLSGAFYDVQANCTNIGPGPPPGTYIKGTQNLDVIVGGQTYKNIRVNTIDMEAGDVTVTCTQNCH